MIGELAFLTVLLLCVGIGATLILDLWQFLLGKLFAVRGADWGHAGRWLKGLAKGEWIYRNSDPSPPRAGDKTLGWLFHYVVGTIYAFLYVPVSILGFGAFPDFLPYILIGFVLSTLAGLMVFSPLMGDGFLASKAPDQGRRIAFAVLNHLVFAAAQYLVTAAVVAGFFWVDES